MTIINCIINKSGTTTPLAGYVSVLANSYLTSASVFYVSSPVVYPLVAGAITFDLIPTDIAKTAYTFSVVAVEPITLLETILYTFEAVVPFSASPINLVSLAPQSGIRYDRRDASLLTLARLLTANDTFINFLGSKLWANRGLWSAATVYKRGDVVLRLNSSYQYTSTLQQANSPPEANAGLWALLVVGSAV